MAFRTLIKYGVPLSFVYCTIYQQDIWREGDDKLFAEQRRVWRDFFNIVDNGYSTTAHALNLTPKLRPESLVGKLDSLNIKECWNSKVSCAFKTIDQAISNPMAVGCKIYRKLQPYISSSTSTPTKTLEGATTAKSET